MIGKTYKIRRRPSIVVLAASIAAMVVPAAQAHNTPVDDWFRGATVTQPQNILVDDWFRDSNLNSQTTITSVNSQGSVTLPRADDPMFREIVQEAAQEHGAAGFGNGLDLSIGLIGPVHVTVVRDAGDASAQRDVSAS